MYFQTNTKYFELTVKFMIQWNEGMRGEKGLKMTMRGNRTEEA